MLVIVCYWSTYLSPYRPEDFFSLSLWSMWNNYSIKAKGVNCYYRLEITWGGSVGLEPMCHNGQRFRRLWTVNAMQWNRNEPEEIWKRHLVTRFNYTHTEHINLCLCLSLALCLSVSVSVSASLCISVSLSVYLCSLCFCLSVSISLSVCRHKKLKIS